MAQIDEMKNIWVVTTPTKDGVIRQRYHKPRNVIDHLAFCNTANKNTANAAQIEKLAKDCAMAPVANDPVTAPHKRQAAYEEETNGRLIFSRFFIGRTCHEVSYHPDTDLITPKRCTIKDRQGQVVSVQDYDRHGRIYAPKEITRRALLETKRTVLQPLPVVHAAVETDNPHNRWIGYRYKDCWANKLTS